MGHRDRWRIAALTAAVAGLVAWPAAALPFLVAAAGLSRMQRAPMAIAPALASAAVVASIAVATSSEVTAWLLALGVLALAPAASLWSSVADVRDGAAIAVGLAVGMIAHLAFATATSSSLPLAGLTTHPNVLGALGAIALPPLIAAAFERHVVGKVARLGAVAALGAVALSGSRGALAAALVAMGWVASEAFRGAARARGGRRRTLGPIVAVVAVVGLLTVAWLGVRQPTFAEAFGSTGRATLWGVAAEGIVARPVFGHGALAWSRVAATIEPSVDAARFPHAHSGYLELALSFGLVGLGAVLAYFLAVYRALSGAHPWRRAARATLLAFAVLNVGDAFVVDARILGLVVLVAGAAGARALTPPAPTPPPPTASPTAEAR